MLANCHLGNTIGKKSENETQTFLEWYVGRILSHGRRRCKDFKNFSVRDICNSPVSQLAKNFCVELKPENYFTSWVDNLYLDIG
jgi:hypothetical protein